MNKIKSKQLGFTLVEIMIVLSFIVLALVPIYSAYEKKQNRTLVKNQTIYLEQLSRSLTNVFGASNNLALVTVPNVISTRTVPRELINNAGTGLRNLWNGNITFDSVGARYGILLSGIPQNVCANLATTDFANAAQEVIVNGTPLKAVGAVSTGASIAIAAGACNSSLNNTIIYRNNIMAASTAPIVDPNPNRPKENPYYIPTVGVTVTSPSVACAGGSTWTGSFCRCPAGSEWNGSICRSFHSVPGACPGGQGWNGTICTALPPITTNPGHTTIADANANSGTAYRAGRYVPQVIPDTNPVTPFRIVVQDAPVAPVTNQMCEARTTPSTHTTPSSGAVIGYWDGITCQTCVNGSWNGFRCVTPTP